MTGCRFLPIVLNAGLMLTTAAYGLAETEPNNEKAESHAIPLEPRASPRLNPRLTRKLTRAFRLAVELTVQSPSCRGLFAELERVASEALGYTIYVPVRPGPETRICEAGAVAYTEVGSSVTRLCPGFERLVDERAAITLIHEALHSAGQGEKPVDPHGLTSDQITRRVARACKNRPAGITGVYPGEFHPKAASRIHRARSVALRQLRSRSACRALFEERGHDGERLMARMTFRVASAFESREICRKRGSALFTTVGGQEVTLCLGMFLPLNTQTQAALLLHEALHHAGVSEQPFDPDGLTSQALTQLVEIRCRL